MGVLLVFALLIVPAAVAHQLTNRPMIALLLSVLLGLLFTWAGLLLALVGHWPVSFYIAALSSISYLIVAGYKRLLTPARYQPQPHLSRECIGEHTAV